MQSLVLRIITLSNLLVLKVYPLNFLFHKEKEPRSLEPEYKFMPQVKRPYITSNPQIENPEISSKI